MDVHKFVEVFGVLHEVALVDPVHEYKDTVDVVTVPTLNASSAVISMSASIGAKSCPLDGPPPESVGVPACDTAAMVNVAKIATVIKTTRVQKNPRDVCKRAELPIFGIKS